MIIRIDNSILTVKDCEKVRVIKRKVYSNRGYINFSKIDYLFYNYNYKKLLKNLWNNCFYLLEDIDKKK